MLPSIAFAPNAYWVIARFCVGGFAHQVLSGTLITLSADVFAKPQAATATGMAGTAAWTGGLLFSLLVGRWPPPSATIRCSSAWRSSTWSARRSSGACCASLRQAEISRADRPAEAEPVTDDGVTAEQPAGKPEQADATARLETCFPLKKHIRRHA